jgi:hypothetical protein
VEYGRATLSRFRVATTQTADDVNFVLQRDI